MTRQEMLEALGRIPDRFQSLVYGLTTDQLARRPKEDEWSIAEILNHLFVGERDVIFPTASEDAPRRIGTTPTRGTLTIKDYARYLANHDHEHLEQLQTIRSVVPH